MFKTAEFQIRQRRYQPNLWPWWLLLLALMDTGRYGVGGFEIWCLWVLPKKNIVYSLH